MYVLLLHVAIVYLVACCENKAEDDSIIALPTNKESFYRKENRLCFKAFFCCLLNVDSNPSAVSVTAVVVAFLFQLTEKKESR